MEATIKFKEFTVNVEEERKAYNSTRLTLAYDVKDTQIENLFKALAQLSSGASSFDLNYIHRGVLKTEEEPGVPTDPVEPPPSLEQTTYTLEAI